MKKLLNHYTIVFLDVLHSITSMILQTMKLIVEAGAEITEEIAKIIEEAGIETVEIRSVLTCESKTGVCVSVMVRTWQQVTWHRRGDAVGIIAAHSQSVNREHSLHFVHSTWVVLQDQLQ